MRRVHSLVDQPEGEIIVRVEQPEGEIIVRVEQPEGEIIVRVDQPEGEIIVRVEQPEGEITPLLQLRYSSRVEIRQDRNLERHLLVWLLLQQYLSTLRS